jgi:hypothetical protein
LKVLWPKDRQHDIASEEGSRVTTHDKGCQAGTRIGVLWRGDRNVKVVATSPDCRLHRVFQALAASKVSAEPVVYSEEVSADVRDQLLRLDGVLVWVNPIDGGRDRSDLDRLLREVSAHGVWVSAHPDVILKMGTKDVLYQTQAVGWGADVHRYASVEQLRRQLPVRLMPGHARVLKQYRGNNGDGVWMVQLIASGPERLPEGGLRLRIRHALRGSVEEETSLDDFIRRCGIYFARGGCMIDQPYQERLPEGMIRCYLVYERVVGFGHQAINALFPPPSGAPASAAPPPGPRLYHPPHKPEFQDLKRRLEGEWVPAMRRALGVEASELPVIWDADFLLGPKAQSGEDTYVLCEINVSSVFPFPEDALAPMAEAVSNAVRRGIGRPDRHDGYV